MRNPLSRLALAGAALLIASTTAFAAPITYNFTTELPLGTTFGTGFFTFDNALLSAPLPVTITQANLTAFSYTDPVVGTLSFSATVPASMNLTFGLSPTTSLFSFTAQSADGLRGFVGAVDGNNSTAPDASFNFGTGAIANPILRFPTASTQPSTVPEPTSVLLIGSGLLGLASARRRRR